MDEFRKPFEYHEEKKGFILFFICAILAVDILQTLSLTAQVYQAFEHFPVLRYACIVIAIVFGLFMLYTLIICSKLKRSLVVTSKIYLMVRAVLSTIYLIISFIYSINTKDLIGYGIDQYETVGDMVFGELVLALIYIWVFSILWYLYFIKSKRCKEIVNARQ